MAICSWCGKGLTKCADCTAKEQSEARESVGKPQHIFTEEQLREHLNKLAANMKPMDPEFAAILNKHFWELLMD